MPLALGSGMTFIHRSAVLGTVLAALVALTAPGQALADPRSAELRIQLLEPSYRWSSVIPGAGDYAQYDRKSLYVAPGLGGRYFPKRGSHGALVEIEYRADSTADDPWCFFGTPSPCPRSKIDFAVVHAGYAYRHTVDSPLAPGKRFWAFTPHISFAAASVKNDTVPYRGPARSPALGGRVGFDIDLHVRRFFLGWSVQYEGLKHIDGPLDFSHFLAWNFIPVFRIGVDLGAPQNSRP